MGEDELTDDGMAAPRRIMIERVTTLIKERGMTMKSVSLAAGLGATYVRDMLKRGRGGHIEHLAAIAQVLGVPLSYFTESQTKSSSDVDTAFNTVPSQKLHIATAQPAVKLVPVLGAVQAGAWMEYEQLADTYEPISAVETKFNGDQFAFKVTGNSMDQRRMQTGDYVICVPYWLNIRQPNNGDVVVVDRRRGDIHERTVKEIVVSGEAVEFWPRSSDPRHKPIVVNPTTWKAEDGDEVEIVGLVISISIPL